MKAKLESVQPVLAVRDEAAPDLHRTEVRDTPWGTREFHVQDPDRNGLQFYRDSQR